MWMSMPFDLTDTVASWIAIFAQVFDAQMPAIEYGTSFPRLWQQHSVESCTLACTELFSSGKTQLADAPSPSADDGMRLFKLTNG
jgi:hypothetical protein